MDKLIDCQGASYIRDSTVGPNLIDVCESMKKLQHGEILPGQIQVKILIS